MIDGLRSNLDCCFVEEVIYSTAYQQIPSTAQPWIRIKQDGQLLLMQLITDYISDDLIGGYAISEFGQTFYLRCSLV